MRKLSSVVLLLSVSGGALGAQAVTGQPAAPPSAACRQTSGGSLRPLPEALLDELERMSSSVFVQAFLLQYVVTTGDSNNWLARCANAFIRTPLDDSAKIVERQVSVTTI